MPSNRLSVSLALALLLAPVPALSQALSGTIVGSVTDESGGAIPNASVTMTNTATGFTRTVTTNFSVNGANAQDNSYLIDGMTNRNLWLNTLIMAPTIDSIQEFRVLTANYSAEYGASAGSVTVVQTKSGSNHIHGSAYEFLRNDK